MSGSLHLAPRSYVGPRRPIDRWLCKRLCRLMISSDLITVATDADSLSNDAEFVLAAPQSWTALKILIAPNLWVGKSYAAGLWYLKKGNLADFLEVIRNEAP